MVGAELLLPPPQLRDAFAQDRYLRNHRLLLSKLTPFQTMNNDRTFFDGLARIKACSTSSFLPLLLNIANGVLKALPIKASKCGSSSGRNPILKTNAYKPTKRCRLSLFSLENQPGLFYATTRSQKPRL